MSEKLLAKLLNFTEADLEANRAAYMTEKQSQIFVKSMSLAQMAFRVSLVSTAVVIIIEFFIIGQTFATRQMIYLGGFVGLVGLGLTYAAYSVRNDNREILASNEVESIQGALWRKKQTVHGRSIPYYEYFVGIGEKRFLVNEQVYTIFVEGEIYTLYFVAKKLLSAERHFSLE